MSCTACHRDIRIVARGYCKACYQRWQKRGTTDYAPPRHRTFCQIDDCGRPVVSNGLCDMHRNRLRRHGHLEPTRPDSWGAKEKHPLYNSWAWLRRHKSSTPLVPEWDDFLQFVMEVGERPSAKHALYRADDSRPIGPDNFVWKEAITQRVAGEDERTYANRARRVYAAVRKEAFQGYELKKRYGVSKAEYENLHDAQNGKCAVCGKPETHKIRGKLLTLSVDHCHAAGHVRALLCSKCNTGLGSFRDDPALLRAAADYLESHAPA